MKLFPIGANPDGSIATTPVTMTAGLVSGVLVATYTTDRATALVDYRLGQLFAGDRDGGAP